MDCSRHRERQSFGPSFHDVHIGTSARRPRNGTHLAAHRYLLWTKNLVSSALINSAVASSLEYRSCILGPAKTSDASKLLLDSSSDMSAMIQCPNLLVDEDTGVC